MDSKLFGGVQGGGSISDVVILDETGKIVGHATGLGTNPWQIGFDECVSRLYDMVTRAKQNAGIADTCLLKALGMSLSGGEMKEAQERIIAGMKEKSLQVSKNYFVCTDTFGSIATAFPNGGMVLISGTGSNCQLLNPSGGVAPRCGGWGHMLGDEGSAFSVAHTAIKTVYDHEDGMVAAPHDVTAINEVITKKFQLKNRYDILPFLYEKFSKSDIAMLCKELAQLANEKKDPMAIYLFHHAGVQLGRHVRALIPKTDKSLLTQPGGLHIVAVGSVLTKAWDLLKDGFLEVLKEDQIEFTLVSLKTGVSSGIGAAALGAKAAGLSVQIDYDYNVNVLYHSQ